jgi:hypothetical protein
MQGRAPAVVFRISRCTATDLSRDVKWPGFPGPLIAKRCSARVAGGGFAHHPGFEKISDSDAAREVNPHFFRYIACDIAHGGKSEKPRIDGVPREAVLS